MLALETMHDLHQVSSQVVPALQEAQVVLNLHQKEMVLMPVVLTEFETRDCHEQMHEMTKRTNTAALLPARNGALPWCAMPRAPVEVESLLDHVQSVQPVLAQAIHQVLLDPWPWNSQKTCLVAKLVVALPDNGQRQTRAEECVQKSALH